MKGVTVAIIVSEGCISAACSGVLQEESKIDSNNKVRKINFFMNPSFEKKENGRLTGSIA
jgi:hypothetical protein